MERSLAQNQERIQELIDNYGSSDQLLLELAEEANSEREIREKIKNLVPLPDDVDDIDSFIEMYEEKQAELMEMNEDKTRPVNSACGGREKRTRIIC